MMDNVYVVGLRKKDDANGAYSICIPHSARYWYADPVLHEMNGKTYLFFEGFDRFLKIGYLSVSEVDLNGEEITCSKPKRIISEPFHLSFPMVFPYENGLYIVPESRDDNSLRIYKMGKTVYDWSLYRRIPLNDSVDTVLFQMDNRVYFINTEEHPSKNLYGRQMIYAMDAFPDGELKLLDASEEYSLTRRNGGAMYKVRDAYVRVCRNCTENFYGKSVSLYEICEFTEDGVYADKLIKTIEAEDLPIRNLEKNFQITGTHTYSTTDRVEAVDLVGNDFSCKNFFAKLIRKFT